MISNPTLKLEATMLRKLPWYVLAAGIVFSFLLLSQSVIKPREYVGTSISIITDAEKIDIAGEGVQIAMGADHYFALQKDLLPPISGEPTTKPLGSKLDKYYAAAKQPIASGTWVVLVPGELEMALTSEKEMTVTVHRVSSTITSELINLATSLLFMGLFVGTMIYRAQHRDQKS